MTKRLLTTEERHAAMESAVNHILIEQNQDDDVALREVLKNVNWNIRRPFFYFYHDTSPLHVAVRLGHYKCVKLMLELKARVEETDPSSVLESAISRKDNEPIIRLLLEHKANPSHEEPGNNVLSKAAQYSCYSSYTMMFIEACAKPPPGVAMPIYWQKFARGLARCQMAQRTLVLVMKKQRPWLRDLFSMMQTAVWDTRRRVEWGARVKRLKK